MAGPGSGLGSSLGLAKETTYGTFVTPTKFPPVESCEIKRRPVYVKGNGLRNGPSIRSKAERALTNADGGGSIKSPVFYNGMGQLFGSLMGSLGTAPVADTSPAYTATHAWAADNGGQSFSMQQGILDTAKTVHNWESMGCKVSDAQFDCAAGQALMSSWTVDCQDHFESSNALTSVTEPSLDYFFSWANMVVKIGTFGSETKIDGVRKWTGTFKRQMDDKRYNAGNVTTNPDASYGIKDEPLADGFSDIGGTLDIEYLTDTTILNYFQTETTFSLIVVFTSPLNAATGFPYSISFNFPCCFFVGDDPTITGPGIVMPSMPYEVWDDETHTPATITVVNTDQNL